jgi:RNase P/RNase MRP subunit POP5
MHKMRRRYVLFRVHREGPPIDEHQLSAAIRKSFLSLFGEVSVADSRLFIGKYNEDEGTGILQCNAESLDRLVASAALITVIDGTQVSFEPKRASGTLKGLER